MRKNKHWYKRHIAHCPTCCREDKWSEVIYGDKPTNPGDRVTYKVQYCGFCLEYS